MFACTRCRTAAAPQDAWCGHCGLQLSVRTPSATPASPAGAARGAAARGAAHPIVPPAKPGTITAAQVLIVLGIVGDAAWAFGGFAFAVVGSRFGDAISRAGGDDGAGATISALSRWLMVFSVLLLVSAAVGVWAFRGVGARRATTRSWLTTFHVLDVLGALSLAGAFGLQAVGAVVIALPVKAVLLFLLWGPENSRRWFSASDPGAVVPAASGGGLDAPTVRLPVAPSGREPGDPRLGVVPLVLAGIVVIALLTVAALAINLERAEDPAVVASGLTACARTFQGEWGPGLASPSGEHMTIAAVGLAIANGSFDSPSATPRRILGQVYQTQDSDGNMLTTVSDRHIADALADPRFARCSADAVSLRGNESAALAVFGCEPRASGPFRMDC